MSCLCTCIKSCCNRTCQRQQLSYYYTQSLRESAIRTFNQQSNTAQNYLLTTATMRIENNIDTTLDFKQSTISEMASSLISDSTTRHTSASLISNIHNMTPNTSKEQDIGNDRKSNTLTFSDRRLHFMHSLFSIPSFERIYVLPEWSQQLKPMHYMKHYNVSHISVPLTTLQLMIYGISRSLGLHIFVVSGFAAFKYGGASTILSFVLCTISTIITAFCLAEFSCRIPMLQNNVYKYIYVTNGEIFAYLIGINSIIISLILSTVSCIVLSGYLQSFLTALSILTQKDIDDDTVLQYLFGKRLNEWINIHLIPSLCALFIMILFIKTYARSHDVNAKQKQQYYRYICSAFTVFIMILFIIVAMMLMSYDEIPDIWLNPCDYGTQCTQNAENAFLPFGIKGFFASSAINLLCFNGMFCVPKLSKYTKKPQRIIKHSIIGTAIIKCIVYTMMMTALLSLIPFETINISSAYSSLFEWMNKTWFQVIFSFCAMLIIINFANINIGEAPHIMHQMGNDGLLFGFFSKMDNELPLVAFIVYFMLCITAAAVFDMRWLVELGAMMNLVSNTLICAGILILRYSRNIHKKYHEKLKEEETGISFQNQRQMLYNGYRENEEDVKYDENMDVIDEQIYTMTLNMEKSKEWSHRSIIVLVWIYIVITVIICILIFYYDEIRSFHVNIWTFITAFLCMVLLYFNGVFIYLHHTLNWKEWISRYENNKNPIFVTPCCPYLPLFGIILNCAMMSSIEMVLSVRLLEIYCVAILIYYLYGIHQSKLYKINRKQYLLNNVKPRYRLTSISSVLLHTEQSDSEHDPNPD